ncbi:hypothetical protein Poly30_03870 [Planctomycetes bacterium Poly30]|uniref:Uncharacterized protein n=1 Tax=Saltatorellus ferox TaxID=2528018 RepID=A0A518ELD2_9BACT|nr:hypothetical protein Poly30_03870 [Planctomycetes bacterium Poly30]
MKMLRLSLLASVLMTAAAAQVTPIATESFDYPVPGGFNGMGGGTGWSNNWYVSGGTNMELAMFDNTTTPMFPLADAIGGHAGQVVPFGESYRRFDLAAHPDLIEPVTGRFGADNTTVWVSFSAMAYAGLPADHFGGISFWHAGGGEVMFMGATWNSNQWGIAGNGGPDITVAGTDDTVAARLVYRVDFLPGAERVRLYVNPATPYPTGAPALDEMTNDLTFDEIRMASGGNNGDLFFFDNIEFAKGEPIGSPGTNYCMANVNSTGSSAVISAMGSTSAANNNMMVMASSLPATSFGFFIVSQTQGFVMNPGGSSGNLCLSGAIGRYVGPGQIQNSGTSGTIGLTLDLTNTPQPNGAVSILPGQTWNYQAWFRDTSATGPTSNFTDGLQIDYL